jgi:Domain of unknown function (DUF4271)
LFLFQNIITSKYYYQPAWVLIIVVALVVIIGYLYSVFRSRLNTFIKAVFITRFSVQISREERSLSNPVSLLFSLNFIVAMSLFLLQLISSGIIFKSQADFSFLSFVILAISIFVIYSFKIIFLKMIDFVLNKREKNSEYIITVFLMTQFLGVLLLPVVIFIYYGSTKYTDIFTYTGILLIVMAFGIRIGKGIHTALTKKDATVFYIILYFCTLEILPVLVGLKWITR